MPQPTAGDVHVNTPLTNISIAFAQKAENFVANKVFPVVRVQKQSDRYYVYTRSFWNRDEAKKRAPGTESAGAGFEVDNTPTYFADVYAVHKDIDDQIRANADAVVNMDRDATRFVTQQLLIRRDKLWATEHFTTSKWTGSTTGGDIIPSTKWDATGGDPIVDINAQMISVQQKTGYMPNVMVFGAKSYNSVRNNDAVIDRIKYTQRGMVTEDLLASLLGVQKVVVARSIENTAVEGAAESSSFICTPEDALLVYAAPEPSLLAPSAGYTFAWNGLLGAGGEGQRIKRFRMEHLGADRVEGEMAMDPKQIAAELGVYFDATVT